MANPLLGILVAAAFTGLVQSSSATTGVVIAMASQGLISLDAGIPLIFGANIGTCVTAMLASLGKPRNALRASLVHVLFNVAGVLLWVFFIGDLARLVTWLSPANESLSGAAKLAAETPRQIANAHTVFNVTNTLLLLPLGGQFARLVERLIPEQDLERDVATGAAPEWTAVHLDPALLAVPSVALEQSRGELLRLGRMLRDMVADVMPAFADRDTERIKAISGRTAPAMAMDEQIDDFLIQISRRNLNEEQSEFASQLMDVSTNLEHLEELLRKDVVPLLERRAEDDSVFAGPGADAVRDYFVDVLRLMDKALDAFDGGDADIAREVVRTKHDLEQKLRASRAVHFEQLQGLDEAAAAAHGMQLDLLDQTRRVHNYCEAVAFTMLHGYLDQRGMSRPRASAA